MILFADEDVQLEYEAIHPRLRQVAKDLSTWSEEWALPPVVLTDVERDEERNRAVDGAENSLHLDRPSRAFDLRTIGPGPTPHYTVHERALVQKYLELRCPSRSYELIFKNHGTGPHFHVGLRRELDTDKVPIA